MGAVLVALLFGLLPIGEAGRIYYNTLLDENAAAHIAFGSGFGGTRCETPARGINRSVIHLDVMIGSPELEATGFDARGRRIPLIRQGAWQIRQEQVVRAKPKARRSGSNDAD